MHTVVLWGRLKRSVLAGATPPTATSAPPGRALRASHCGACVGARLCVREARRRLPRLPHTAPPPSAQLAATTQSTPCMHPCCATTAKEKLGEREPPQPPRNIGPGLAGPVNESDTTPTRVGSSDGCHFAWLSSCLSSSFFSACVCVPRDCAYCGRRATVHNAKARCFLHCGRPKRRRAGKRPSLPSP